jgi:hypothetical protein
VTYLIKYKNSGGSLINYPAKNIITNSSGVVAQEQHLLEENSRPKNIRNN